MSREDDHPLLNIFRMQLSAKIAGYKIKRGCLYNQGQEWSESGQLSLSDFRKETILVKRLNQYSILYRKK